jgi:hypothetical protein
MAVKLDWGNEIFKNIEECSEVSEIRDFNFAYCRENCKTYYVRCVLGERISIFSTTFARNIFQSDKYLVSSNADMHRNARRSPHDAPYFCLLLTKIRTCQQILLNLPDTNFNYNPFSHSRIVTYGHCHDEASKQSRPSSWKSFSICLEHLRASTKGLSVSLGW